MLFVLLLACRNDKDPIDTAISDWDGDGAVRDEDCDDQDPTVHPGAEELCDGVDQDCDGQVDEGVTGTFYVDADRDGWGAEEVQRCSGDGGTVEQGGDCDDADGQVNPNAWEVCNGVDDDCDGVTDTDAVDRTEFFEDGDGDGFGSESSTWACEAPEGHVEAGDDCDDADSEVNPDAEERCNGVDDDCNGFVDAEDPGLADGAVWYLDLDGDGYGWEDVSEVACVQPSGWVADATDCDDTEPAVNPGAVEVCNSLDDDCDDEVDDDDADLDSATATTWYADADGDGWGDPAVSTLLCAQPSNTVTDDSDCDDADDAINPDAAEVCDGVDNDCDGAADDGAEGSDQTCAAASCKVILDAGAGSTDGLYWLDPDDDGDTSDAWEGWCDMSNGGWTKLFSSAWPTWWSASNYTDVGSPTDADYSDLAELGDFEDANGGYTFRLTVGDGGSWDAGPVSHYTEWTQGHDPFTTTTDGSDYSFLGGEESTTCSGFNGLHARHYTAGTAYSMTSDVDSGDGLGCWWMQVVPLKQYVSGSSYPGYLEGYSGPNTHVWQALWVQ